MYVFLEAQNDKQMKYAYININPSIQPGNSTIYMELFIITINNRKYL